MANPKPGPAPSDRLAAQAQRPGRLPAWLHVVVALVLVAGVTFAITGLDDGSDRESGPTGGGSASLEHVHGVGVDPEDGAVYAGSHYGLFRATKSGSLEGPVAGRVQDFMGFTVVGPGHFLASGHPGEEQDGPGSLGLIESTDAGQTWTSRSLAGEADFHALAYRDGTVYGFNSLTGEFMVSADMETWETRSTLPMADFALSPDMADTILATTEQGPALSTDGGRSFEAVPGTPFLILVSWADDGTLVGVDPEGTVYVGDGPSSLVRTGTLGGAPQALDAQVRRISAPRPCGRPAAPPVPGRTDPAVPPRGHAPRPT
jgi:hypothetical protein